MAQITEADVEAASEKVRKAKTARGTSAKGKAFEAYLEAVDELTATRRAFREQEEAAGRRVGFVNTEDGEQ